MFIATLEKLEEAFIATYLAAVKEFCLLGQPGLAQIAAQICGIEAEPLLPDEEKCGIMTHSRAYGRITPVKQTPPRL